MGLTGHIISNRESVFLRNLEDNVKFHKKIGVEVLGERAKAWLGVPLIATDKVVGVMAVQSYKQENLYGDQDVALF